MTDNMYIRLKWLSCLLSPLMDLWVAFQTWRTSTRMLVNMNSQIGVLEGYLRNKYNEPIAIRIESYADGLLWVPLASESEAQQPEFHSDYTQVPVPEIPLQFEIRDRFSDVDFIVYIPVTIDKALIQAEIDTYRQALIKYKIIQS